MRYRPILIQHSVFAPVVIFKGCPYAEPGFPLQGGNQGLAFVCQGRNRPIKDAQPHAAGDIHPDGVGNNGIPHRQHAAYGQPVAGMGIRHERPAHGVGQGTGVFHLTNGALFHLHIAPLLPGGGRFARFEPHPLREMLLHGQGQRTQHRISRQTLRRVAQSANRRRQLLGQRALGQGNIDQPHSQRHDPFIVGNAQPRYLLGSHHRGFLSYP